MAGGGGGKRNFDPVTLSFLDVISCGFGAIVLLFLVSNHSSQSPLSPNDPKAAEVKMLDEQILDGKSGLVRARNTMATVDDQLAKAQGLARRIEDQLDPLKAELIVAETDTNSKEETIAKLKQDIAALDVQLAKLRDEEKKQSGNSIRRFIGDGNRQYLTGLIMGGSRILVLVDTSASMLDNTIVNILRRRNMSDADKLKSPKWTQVRKTLDWLTARLPPPSQYQIYAFNNQVHAVVPGTEGSWLEVADKDKLNKAVELMKNTVPTEGTNLENVFAAVRKLNPLPDNIFLITDGLPTLDSRHDSKGKVTGPEREQIFEYSLRQLPPGIPVSIILEPLEGDPMAASEFWKLAIATHGALMTPATDWP